MLAIIVLVAIKGDRNMFNVGSADISDNQSVQDYILSIKIEQAYTFRSHHIIVTITTSSKICVSCCFLFPE